MSVNLNKGGKISLLKSSGESLEKISVGLGWGRKRGFLGTKSDVDLDASALLYDNSSTLVDVVFFGKLATDDGSVVHTGDDLAGGGQETEPNEVINLDLNRVPGNVKSVVFVVNSYSGESFKGIPFAFSNVVDRSTSTEICRYNLSTDGGNYKGFVIAKVSKAGAIWEFNAIGEQCHGRQQTLNDIEPQARQHA